MRLCLQGKHFADRAMGQARVPFFCFMLGHPQCQCWACVLLVSRLVQSSKYVLFLNSFIISISLESQEGVTHSLQRKRKKRQQTFRREQKPEIPVLNTWWNYTESPVLWPSGSQFYLESTLHGCAQCTQTLRIIIYNWIHNVLRQIFLPVNRQVLSDS